MPKVFALLEATSCASDHGVAMVQAVVAGSLCCGSSTSLGSESMNVSAQEKERKKEREMLRNNNQPVETPVAVAVPLEAEQQTVNPLPGHKEERCPQQTSTANRQQNKHVKIQGNINQLVATQMAAVLATAQQVVTATTIANKNFGNNQPAATAMKITLCSSIGNRASSSFGNSTSAASGDSKKQQSME